MHSLGGFVAFAGVEANLAVCQACQHGNVGKALLKHQGHANELNEGSISIIMQHMLVNETSWNGRGLVSVAPP